MDEENRKPELIAMTVREGYRRLALPRHPFIYYWESPSSYFPACSLLRRSRDWKIRQTLVRQTLDAALPVPSDKITILGTVILAPEMLLIRNSRDPKGNE